jgi:hypothetical protein
MNLKGSARESEEKKMVKIRKTPKLVFGSVATDPVAVNTNYNLNTNSKDLLGNNSQREYKSQLQSDGSSNGFYTNRKDSSAFESDTSS